MLPRVCCVVMRQFLNLSGAAPSPRPHFPACQTGMVTPTPQIALQTRAVRKAPVNVELCRPGNRHASGCRPCWLCPKADRGPHVELSEHSAHGGLRKTSDVKSLGWSVALSEDVVSRENQIPSVIWVNSRRALAATPSPVQTSLIHHSALQQGPADSRTNQSETYFPPRLDFEGLGVTGWAACGSRAGGACAHPGASPSLSLFSHLCNGTVQDD